MTPADFVSDATIAQRWGVKLAEARVAIQSFERHPINLDGQCFTFPKADPLFPGRRFWPAVEVYMLARHGITSRGPSRAMVPDGQGDLHAADRNRRRAGPVLAAAR